MEDLRKSIDQLELNTKDLWPVPTYGDMLLNVEVLGTSPAFIYHTFQLYNTN